MQASVSQVIVEDGLAVDGQHRVARILQVVALEAAGQADGQPVLAAERTWRIEADDVVDCIDEERSEFGKWTEYDGRPDMVGRYRGMPKMVITSDHAAGHDLSLVKNWEVAMICTKTLRDALVAAGATGIRFVPVVAS